MKTCLYCGKPARGIRRGEHIIPEALGGTRTIKCVCMTCNNETLSRLDDELVSRSFLSVLLLGSSGKKLKYSWDVDHESGNMQLEADAQNEFTTMKLYPQIIFCEDGPQLRGDEAEYSSVGSETFQELFVQHLCEAYSDYNNGTDKSKLIFEHIRYVPAGKSFPPRVFSRKRIVDFKHGMHFICRYKNRADKEFLLKNLDTLKPTMRFGTYQSMLGSPLPGFNLSFDVIRLIRALTKIGINLLANYCTATTVNNGHFREAIRFVMTGGARDVRRVISRCGFVAPSEMRALWSRENVHRFRLVYFKWPGKWYMYCAFFGGRACAKIEFVGPSEEPWSTIDITAPIGSPDWRVRRHKKINDIPLSTISWEEATIGKVIPTLPQTPSGEVVRFEIKRKFVQR
ncbi:MAG: hypothetical protein O7D91_04145 [Planctomycetota bacterium]|nr:hypothetical protein [Planctomycetota bacterium]